MTSSCKSISKFEDVSSNKSYLRSNEAKVNILGANEAEDQVVNWLSNIMHAVCRDEQGL